jgi:MFS family permease
VGGGRLLGDDVPQDRHLAVGPFLKPMVADLGRDRASDPLVLSLSRLLYGQFMPVIGALDERFGARIVTGGGVVLFGASVAGTGLGANLWPLTLAPGVLVAVGLAAAGHVLGSAVLSRWFVRRRATALSPLGTASMAGLTVDVRSCCGLVLRPVATDS